MANNYKYGKDFTTGGFPALANHFFVSKYGDDINAGSDPDLPKLTIQSALTACPDNGTIVVAGGIYDEYDLIDVGTGKTIIGDGPVYFDRFDESLVMTGATLLLQNISVRQYSVFGTSVGVSDCVVGINTINIDANPVDTQYSNFNVFENTTINIAEQPSPPADAIIDNAIFNNCVINYGENGLTRIKNSHFESTCLLNLQSISDADQFEFCNINCAVTMNNVLYNSLEAAKEFGSFVECINVDADFLGASVGNYSLGSSSGLFGKGENANNITNRTLGFGFNSTSTEVVTGTGDVTFNQSGEWISSGDSAQWVTAPIDLFKVRKLGSFDLIGLVDYMNNVPDFDNKSVNVNQPNNLDLELRWANNETDLSLATYQSFRWNEQPTFDGLLYNGEAGFNWSLQQSISAKYIQVKVIIRNNYTV